MNIYHIIGYLGINLLFHGSCQMSTPISGIKESLSLAGYNHDELQQVIHHYQEGEDSLKLKAAIFLIENMADKCYFTEDRMNDYCVFIDSTDQIEKEKYDILTISNEYHEESEYWDQKLIYRLDVQSLSASYLIGNIEKAFAVWKQPWNQHLSFEDFCELILPYRIGTETPEEWRSLFQKHFEQFLQSDTIRTAKEACIIINNELIKLPVPNSATASYHNKLIIPQVPFNKFYSREDRTNLAIFAMRALGIPVAIEIIPHWGQRNSSHIFNVLYDNDRTTHDFLGGKQNPDEHLIRFKNEIPKVYRKTFRKQMNSLAMLHGDEDIPIFFKNAYITDVTSNYPFIGAKDIAITFPNKIKQKFAYLCVFDPNGWTPVAWTNIVENKAKFQSIGPNIIYHAALYTNGKTNLIGNPFLVDTLGQISYYTAQQETMEYVLEQKSPEGNNLKYLPPLMVGCQFQGADNPKFKNPVTFHTITKEPDFKFITVQSENTTPVKYVRYLASDKTKGDMAEIEFCSVNSNVPLEGQIIGKDKPSTHYPRYGIEMLFDGDVLTFFHSQDTLSWGGLELDKPTAISKIRYIIRNNGNGIRRCHKYELFYMSNGKWESLGKQTATKDNEILYSQIPKGALYWLHDHTKSSEERIFEIKNNTIIWH